LSRHFSDCNGEIDSIARRVGTVLALVSGVGGFMRKLLMTILLVSVSQNALAEGLTDALSKAIQSSDTEKANTKVVLSVTVDQIEKATFRRGQGEQVIKDESTVISDNSYQAQQIERSINTNDETQLESISQELESKRN
jgi:hypothetical protein